MGSKARNLADFVSTGNPLADNVISVSEVDGAAPLASPTFTGTLTYATLNDGTTSLTSTVAELNYVDGVTSNVQTQLDAKAPTASPTFTGDLTVDTNTLYVDSTNDRVGVGTSSPSANLEIDAGAASGTHLQITTSGSGHNFYMTDSGGTARIRNAGGILRIGADLNGESVDSRIQFEVDDTDLMHIDSNGNVGIGGVFSSETIDSTLHVASSTAEIRIEDTNNGTGGTSYTPKLTFDANGTEVGSIGYTAGNLDITTENFNGSDIRFFTGGSYTMGLTTLGYLELGTNTSIAGSHPTLVVHGDSARIAFELYRPATNSGGDLQTWRSDIGGAGTKVADVENNGDFNSATGNYATLSDERLKQDITPANSQWDDIKALEFKNYRMINLVETMGDDAPVYFGVIAQQLEAAGMNGLVEDKVDDDTQEVTKIVKTSILQMKAVKALQEAMERIEALEAEVAALKGSTA